MNIQWSKQPPYTWSCLLNLPFLVCFCYFWKVESLLVLNLFISEYLDKILPWKEMKLTFSVKLLTEYLLLKIKFKQNLGCLNKEYNKIFEHIHQNIRVYPRSKKIRIDRWQWMYYCLFRRVQAKRCVGEQMYLLPDRYRGSEGQCHLLSFKLGDNIPST